MKKRVKESVAALVIAGAILLPGCSFLDKRPEELTQINDAAFTTTAPQMDSTAGETVETLPQKIAQPEPKDDDFVKVINFIPDVVVELPYSSENNFTKRRIYDFSDVWLRYGTVKKLILVQNELKNVGYSIKIWDGFRPPSAQFKLWDVCPDPTYVSNPNNGFSSHSRGNTVDITLVDVNGEELTMPTGFDDFSEMADRDYSDCAQEAADNALFLEQLMIRYGFKPYAGEWWHFSDTNTYPVDENFEPIMPEVYYADCNEFISLRTGPSTASDVITKISNREQFVAVAKCGAFALVEFRDVWGYVRSDYIKPAN